ncbi:hypothetical protein [Sedimentitalea nanhaiensis]|uniref:Sulfotransferase family protein n=1 Tax=Sedimentitalea nanhaiensis TaxID=999627 RepID=A0A1I7E1V8_9RHOB|nr:hypothetical protein [Sedimentitalea nanhaiensis]SFU17928.1 hypothetical protein SAMN05216236_14117 [Sedimentitalea nanhaiensis]
MYDYGRLVFLDNQKTGSTYVSLFLKSCCALEHIKSAKHRPITASYRDDAVYFSTVRKPVSLYISLFQYGRDKRGSTYTSLRKRGLLDLYESFPRWLEFVLDEANAPIFQEQYGRFAHLGIGIMSYRAMRITLQYPTKTLLGAKSHDDLIDIWSRHNIAHHIFRQEELNVGLYQFATETVPEFFHQDAVRSFLDSPERVNVSKARKDAAVPGELMQRILEKEQFLTEKFYPDRQGQPSGPPLSLVSERSAL